MVTVLSKLCALWNLLNFWLRLFGLRFFVIVKSENNRFGI